MKYPLLLILLLLGLGSCTQKNDARFLVMEDGYYGYIDQAGNIVIPAVFLAATDFSEGLAAVRQDGNYGYIDIKGNFVIPPQFDYATSFSEGLAVVYNDARPFYIDRQGQTKIRPDVAEAGPFLNGRAEVTTSSRKTGLLNKAGVWVVDTIYTSIGDFREGVGRAWDMGTDSTPAQTSLIDTNGKVILAPGKYNEIYQASGGYLRVDSIAQPTDSTWLYYTGFIDKKGKTLWMKQDTKACEIDGDISCGRIRLRLYKTWLPENGYANRAFVQDKNYNWLLIGLDGRKVNAETFEEISGETFRDGIAFVKQKGRWGAIDTNGHYVLAPALEQIGYCEPAYLFFVPAAPGNTRERQIGIRNKEGRILCPPKLQQADPVGFRNGLLCCRIDKKLSYIDTNGKLIWQEKKSKASGPRPLNIDFKSSTSFYAASTAPAHENKGYGRSGDMPLQAGSKNHFPAGVLSVRVRIDSISTVYADDSSANPCILVQVSNQSSQALQFPAQDSRLAMKIQAKDKSGTWQDIQYMPGSFCGNSYHILTLEPGYYWRLLAPVYAGAMKTRMRIVLEYTDPEDKTPERWNKKQLTVYSNEYEGSVNPGQFWRKEPYFRSGIMDPYID
jgi:hypothetical protein